MISSHPENMQDILKYIQVNRNSISNILVYLNDSVRSTKTNIHLFVFLSVSKISNKIY